MAQASVSSHVDVAAHTEVTLRRRHLRMLAAMEVAGDDLLTLLTPTQQRELVTSEQRLVPLCLAASTASINKSTKWQAAMAKHLCLPGADGFAQRDGGGPLRRSELSAGAGGQSPGKPVIASPASGGPIAGSLFTTPKTRSIAVAAGGYGGVAAAATTPVSGAVFHGFAARGVGTVNGGEDAGNVENAHRKYARWRLRHGEAKPCLYL
eukprot:TRINITY_DN12800_c0_g1_i1.p1 TRINITY_DN12800_c0_g1~~TRINITY_DN12800_c0_g1_i1.p1  ORF type:complete len:208 (-),score=42.19 TRINITY_DN12800_c0_g1_i1:126-749(-)